MVMCLSVSLMESQVSRVTTSTAHGVLMRGRQSISPKVSRYRALSWARDPGLELPRALQSAVSMARPGLHTLNTNSHILNTEERDQERSVTNIDNIP